MRRSARRGFSLMEVLLATSILLACAVVLVELAEVGRRHAERVDELTTAQLICQTKLNEIVAGIAPLTAVEEATVTEAPEWVYSVELEPQTNIDLVVIRVTVVGQANDVDAPSQRRKKSFTLTRWVHRETPGIPAVDREGTLPQTPTTLGFGEELLP